MIITLKDTTEAKSYSVKSGKYNHKVTVNRSGVCNYIEGKEVYLTSIEVKTAVDNISVTVIGKGRWDQIKEKYEVVGWEFKPCQ